MSRITGNDAKGLMEAYGAVYQPKQLTEEQVWEGVEKWVNALVEEGYDLSDYTWEEMYEAYGYVVEQMAGEFPDLVTPVVTAGLGAATYLGGKVWDAAKKMFVSRSKTKPQEPDYGQTSFSASKETPAQRRERVAARVAAEHNRKQQGDTEKKDTPKPEEVAKLEARQKIKIKKPQVDLPKPPKENTAKDLGGEINLQNTPGQSSAPSSAGGGGGAAKPPGFGEKLRQRMQSDTARRTAEREARRARPNPIGQAVQDKAVDLTARGMDKLATAAKNVAIGALGVGGAGAIDQGLLGGVGGKVAGDALNFTRQSGPAYDKLMGRGPKPETSTPVGTPGQSPTVPAGMKIIIGPDGKNKVVPVQQSFDLFDVVKGHLLDEGYADTEEAALVIMANMSEEWRESIVEGMFDFLPKTKTVISNKPEDKRNPLQKYSDATKPLFAGLPKTKTVIKK
jgi:hypothetical protein